MRKVHYASLLLGLMSCGPAGPDPAAWWRAAPPSPYHFPHDPAVSDAQGRPRDSLTFYLPAVDSLYYCYPEGLPGVRRDARRDLLQHLSAELYYCQAPVLANVPRPGRTWRALRHSGFAYTLLLTVYEPPQGRPQLRVQALDRYSVIGGPTAPPPPPPELRDVRGRRTPPDTAGAAANRAYEAWRQQRPQLLCDARRPLTPAEWQGLKPLFEDAMPAASGVSAGVYDCCDGETWLLEMQAPGQYRFWVQKGVDEALSRFARAAARPCSAPK